MNEATTLYLYLDLMKRCLTDLIHGDRCQPVKRPRRFFRRRILAALERRGLTVVRRQPLDRALRVEGRDWPLTGHTMIGLRRLDNLQFCVEDVLARGVPGDLIEAGVWRGGACIFMRAILKAHGVQDRCVWLADSFQGVPRPNPERYPADAGSRHHAEAILAVSQEEVQENFIRYGLLDDQVRFLKGWFRDTMPGLSGHRWAVIRVDGDIYESTMDVLVNLYPNLSVGGYVIIDDYGAIPACRQAVEDYRRKQGISEELRPIDWTGVFWQRR